MPREKESEVRLGPKTLIPVSVAMGAMVGLASLMLWWGGLSTSTAVEDVRVHERLERLELNLDRWVRNMRSLNPSLHWIDIK